MTDHLFREPDVPAWLEVAWDRMMRTIERDPELDRFVRDAKAAVAKLEEEQRAQVEEAINGEEQDVMALAMPTPLQRKILTLLRDRPGLTQTEIARELKVSRSRISLKITNELLFRSEQPPRVGSRGHAAKRYYVA